MSIFDSYDAACAAAEATAGVDHLTVSTRYRKSGKNAVLARGAFVDCNGVALFGFRIAHEP
ncbi:hypothetical protein ACAG26_12955 [Mycobacterium sp. pUA109]|uniref:hypothetical protein n=1 Tax=Mycobacterium sp. pUA109 TaxID=3238982 RepID=UPI00351AD406